MKPLEPIRVSFLDPADHGLQGAIGLTVAPGARGLDADLDHLQEHYGMKLLVSLLEPKEYERFGIAELPQRARAKGIEHVRFPIPDWSAPPAARMSDFLRLIEKIVRRVRSGDTVVIHCFAGIGRSGTVAASCLVFLGLEPGAAIARVRAVRPGAVEVS